MAFVSSLFGQDLRSRPGVSCALSPSTLDGRTAVAHPRRRRVHACLSNSNSVEASTDTVHHEETDELLKTIRSRLDSGQNVTESEIQSMVVHLGDSRGMARLGLVEAFGCIGREAVPFLLESLQTCENPVVRRSCAKALAKIGDSRATDVLIRTLLEDVDTVTRSSAAGALARMGFSAVPKLLAVIADENSSMTAKGHASWAISFMQGEASDALFERVQDSNADVRLAVVSALGGIAAGNELPSLGGTASVEDAVYSLEDDELEDDDGSEADGPQRERALECLTQSLTDSSAEVRAEAVTALANAGATRRTDAVLGLLEDPAEDVRRAAAMALMKLGTTAALDKLNRCANNSSEADSVRAVARLAVSTLSKKR